MILDNTLVDSESGSSAKTVCAVKMMISSGLSLMIFLNCYQCAVEEVKGDGEGERGARRQNMTKGSVVDTCEDVERRSHSGQLTLIKLILVRCKRDQ